MTDTNLVYFLMLVAVYYLARGAIWLFASSPIANDPYGQPNQIGASHD